MIRILLLIGCLTATLHTQAQRYQGVVVKNSSYKQKQPRVKGEGARWQLMAGGLWTAGTNMNSSPSSFNPAMNDFSLYHSGFKFGLRRVQEKQSFELQAAVVHQDATYKYKIQENTPEECLDLFSFGIGYNRHWWQDEHWMVYSGVSVGYSVGSKYLTVSNQGNINRHTIGLVNWEATLLGLEYRQNKIGGFLRLTYGTMGFCNAGLLYRMG